MTSKTHTADKKPPPNFVAADYNKVVQTAKLFSVQLTKIDFKVDEKFFAQKGKRSLVMNREYLNFVFDRKQQVVAGEFRFSFQTKGPVDNLIGCIADYLVIYEIGEDANEAAAIDFCKRVGVFASYPYYRALVAHLSWAANAHLPPMPVIGTRGALMKDASALSVASPVSTTQTNAPVLIKRERNQLKPAKKPRRPKGARKSAAPRPLI